MDKLLQQKIVILILWSRLLKNYHGKEKGVLLMRKHKTIGKTL